MLNIIIGIIPGIIWMIVFITLDHKAIKNNYKELLVLFLLGAIGSYLCYRLEMHFGTYFKKVKDSNYLEILLYAIFGVAIFEEGYKWFINILTLIKRNNKRNIMLNTIFTSIGFSTFENVVYYAIPYGANIALTRTFTAYISHIGCAIWMGYFLEQNQTKNNKIYPLISLLSAVITHALYNSFLYGNKYKAYFNYYYIIFIISTIILLIKRKRRCKNEL